MEVDYLVVEIPEAVIYDYHELVLDVRVVEAFVQKVENDSVEDYET